MRSRTRTAAVAAATLATGLAAAGEEPAPPPPRPGPSDFFRYELRRVTTKNGKESLGKAAVATLRGSDLRDEGLYLPTEVWRADLPRLVAFRFVPSGKRTWRFRFVSIVETIAEASFRSEPAAGGGSTVSAEWTFASRPKGDEAWVIEDGRAAATITVGADGIVQSARVSVTYRMPKEDPDKDDEEKSTDGVWQFTLKDARKPRYDEFHADVAAAIDRGVARLRKETRADGTFEPYKDYAAGSSALAIYTLLSCGVARDDPQVEKALDGLASADPSRNYELAVGLMAMERAYVVPGDSVSESKAGSDMPAARRAWCVKAAARLESQNAAAGSFGYGKGGDADTSNTQYAVLGLRAAARMGIAVDDGTWLGVIRHFVQRREQGAPKADLLLVGETESDRTAATRAATPVREAAGFLYQAGEATVRASMTAAGIASLAIARDELQRVRSRRFTPVEAAQVDTMIAGGWAWIDRHWGIDRHPGRKGDDWQLYWLYSLERAGLLTGVRLVNGKDWYFDGAMQILATQAKDGSWKDEGGELASTCFALLFLKRATAPAAAATGK